MCILNWGAKKDRPVASGTWACGRAGWLRPQCATAPLAPDAVVDWVCSRTMRGEQRLWSRPAIGIRVKKSLAYSYTQSWE